MFKYCKQSIYEGFGIITYIPLYKSFQRKYRTAYIIVQRYVPGRAFGPSSRKFFTLGLIMGMYRAMDMTMDMYRKKALGICTWYYLLNFFGPSVLRKQLGKDCVRALMIVV